MFNLFEIIYFTPFYFPNGNPAKNKFFIPIAKLDNQFVFASLPTSKDFVPDELVKHGCVNEYEKQISCYIFIKDKLITNNGFSFNKNTFIYYYQILKLSTNILEETYTKVDVDYEVIGSLNDIEKRTLIDCMLKSRNVTNKIKRFLTEYKKETLSRKVCKLKIIGFNFSELNPIFKYS